MKFEKSDARFVVIAICVTLIVGVAFLFTGDPKGVVESIESETEYIDPGILSALVWSEDVLNEPRGEPEEEGILLEGEWEYECDILYFNNFDWYSSIKLGNEEFTVRAGFDDLDLFLIMEDHTRLAFMIYQEYDSLDWLYIKSDGDIDPDLNYFRESDTAEIYPGGYEALERDLRSLGIDWATLNKKLTVEFLLMYLQLDPDDCKPPSIEYDGENA